MQNQNSEEDNIDNSINHNVNIIKRPIPLPRNKLNIETLMTSSNNKLNLEPSSSNSSVKSESTKSDSSSSSMKSSNQSSFRRSLRTASESSKSKIEKNTKQIRSKLKNVLSRPNSISESSSSKTSEDNKKSSKKKKRQSVFHDALDTTEEDSKNKTRQERCQSLPAVDDIFNKITFVSPLDLGTQIKHWCGGFDHLNSLESLKETKELHRERYDSEQTSNADDDDDDDDTISDMTESLCDGSSLFFEDNYVSTAPPQYPPPPLPNENFRDDVSIQSGMSDACSFYTAGVIDTDSFYDEVIGTVSKMQNINLQEIKLDENNPSNKRVSRSDSWNYIASSPHHRSIISNSSKEPSFREEEFDESSPSSSDRVSSDLVSSESSSSNNDNQLKPTHSNDDNQVSRSTFYISSNFKQNNNDKVAQLTNTYIKNQKNNSKDSLDSISESCGSYVLNHDDTDNKLNKLNHDTDDTFSEPGTNRNQQSNYENYYLNDSINRPKSLHAYENWELKNKPDDYKDDIMYDKGDKKFVHSKSVIFEFDPLSSFDQQHIPEPPKRFDSIGALVTTSEINIDDAINENKQGNSFVDEIDKSKEDINDSTSSGSDVQNGKRKIVRWTSMKRAFKNLADPMRRGSSKLAALEVLINTDSATLERPSLNFFNVSALYNGMLYKANSNNPSDKPKDLSLKYFQLGEGKLIYGADKNAALKELFSLDTVLSIKQICDIKESAERDDVYCFTVYVSSKHKSFVLGATSTSERRIWMQKILENLTSHFPARLTSEYARAGWCRLKEGVTDEWNLAWVILCGRSLSYTIEPHKLVDIDLKKARCIALQEDDSGNDATKNTEFILVDTTSIVVYLQMDTPQETYSWRHDLKTAATNNGPYLHEQQLTTDEIPTLVDKCIKFVYVHGSMSEGIYRKSGSNSSVSYLLAQFRQDAWSVQISRSDYTEYDVANVLKRFFRDLPEPLLTTELHKHLCNTAGMYCSPEDKCNIYRSLLEKLPQIHYVTVRKLMGHLYFIQQKKERNLMSIENLAALWGPTLMHVENKDCMLWTVKESEVVSDLISFYQKLFLVDEEELQREEKMMSVLDKLYKNSSSLGSTTPPRLQDVKQSGDLKVWVHLGNKDSNDCVNVILTPNKEAGMICQELANRMNTPSHELCLMEVICEGSLTRILHHRQKVLDVVLEWGLWDDIDCKDNSLVLTTNEMLRNEIAPMASQSLAVSGDLKFADKKSKSFKTYLFEFSQSKLRYFKDKQGSVQLGEWMIEDIIWYMGYEKKRNPQTRWAITFIDKKKSKRSKECPYFGCTLAGSNKTEQCKWMAAMLFGQYSSSDVLPKVSFI